MPEVGCRSVRDRSDGGEGVVDNDPVLRVTGSERLQTNFTGTTRRPVTPSSPPSRLLPLHPSLHFEPVSDLGEDDPSGVPGTRLPSS